MAEIYRAKVEHLSESLNAPDLRAEAVEILRGLVETITLTPEEDGYAILLKGDLAGILTLASSAGSTARTCRRRCSVTIFASIVGCGGRICSRTYMARAQDSCVVAFDGELVNVTFTHFYITARLLRHTDFERCRDVNAEQYRNC